MDKALFAIISGRVQLVFFRNYACDKALCLNLVGEVENLPDGTVRIYAQGTEEKLTQFIDFLEEGPPMARVDHVSCKWIEPKEGHDTFSIIRS